MSITNPTASSGSWLRGMRGLMWGFGGAPKSLHLLTPQDFNTVNTRTWGQNMSETRTLDTSTVTVVRIHTTDSDVIHQAPLWRRISEALSPYFPNKRPFHDVRRVKFRKEGQAGVAHTEQVLCMVEHWNGQVVNRLFALLLFCMSGLIIAYGDAHQKSRHPPLLRPEGVSPLRNLKLQLIFKNYILLKVVLKPNHP